jgi:hypothetical protein
MPISPINFFAPPQIGAAAETQAFANPTALGSLTGLSQTALANFTTVLGQVLGALGPLGLTNALGTTGGGAGAGGLTNNFFELFLLNALGQGQFNTQNTVQRFLQTEFLLNTLNTTAGADQFGLTTAATDQIATTLVRQLADGNLFVQLNNVTTNPNPMAFATAALAQDIQLANAVELPA